MKKIAESELILNPDGSIYHIALRPEQLADTIITVGDPKRVERVSSFFDEIEFKQQKREFVTHTGRIGHQRLTVIATGIGTDNIDIVLNELDALVNIDLETRLPKKEHKSLNIVRMGTSGAIRADIPVDSLLVSNYAIGLEGLMLFYKENPNAKEEDLKAQLKAFLQQKDFKFPLEPTVHQASSKLLQKIQGGYWHQGITLTATGFYAPQNRQLRAKSTVADLFDVVKPFEFEGLHLTNLEMETSAIYGLANVLGHQALSINAILANRPNGQFSKDPKALEMKLIEQSLAILLA